VLRFDCFAGNGVPHFRQGRAEKEKAEQIRPFPASAAAHEATRRSDDGALEHAPPAFLHTILAGRGFLCSSWSFEDCFVKFELFDVIFIYFLIL
jgi:hypothetical protein